MNEIFTIVLYSFFAGITVFLGGLLSKFFEKFPNNFLKQRIVHSSIAFGGGIIIAAVAFVLVPRGMDELSLIPMILLFLFGAIVFYFLDKAIEKRGGEISQVLAMLMDFIPEAIALGAIFAHDKKLGLLLSLFIGLQNFPESFNAYLDLRNTGFSSKKTLTILFCLSFTGIIAALLGDFFLSDKAVLTASLMQFAGGGILYLIFQDIAPMSKIKDSWSPALGSTLGFLVGMIGQKILG